MTASHLAPSADAGRAPLARAPRALRWAFEKYAAATPRAARRAAAALDFLLEGIYTSAWPEVAWSASLLTGDFPCALAFSSADETIRYETEVAGHEMDEAARLDYAERRLALLGAGRPPAEVGGLLRRVQSAGGLTYGAWISGRHDAQTDRYKIYAEVPASNPVAAEDWARRLFGDAPLVAGRAPSLRMIGYEFSTSRLEFYYRLKGMELSAVGMLLRRAGLSEHEGGLRELMEDAFAYPLRLILPTTKVGFSLSVMPGGIAVSIFAFAHHVFGRDQTTRRRLLEMGARRGWGLRSYALLTEPLASGGDAPLKHGMVSFIAAPQAPPTLYVGLRLKSGERGPGGAPPQGEG